MDLEPHQLLDFLPSAKAGLEVAEKTGLLERLRSLVNFRKKGDEVNYLEEVRKAALGNALEIVRNQELAFDQALQILSLQRDFTIDDLTRLNSTWKRHWGEGTSKTGTDDEERRTWWARLLAGEIQQPGTF